MTGAHEAAPRRLRRDIVPLLIVVLLAGAAVGVVGYVFRDRLTAMPYVGTWFAATTTEAPAMDPSHDMPGAETHDTALHAEPRAPITLDLRRQQLIGVRTATAERTDLTTTVRTVGMVRYDETRLTDVNVKLDGWIRELYVDFTGQFVKTGQPLFTLYSPELLSTESEYLLALKTRDQLSQSDIPDVRDSADRLVASARQRLELWDLPPEELQALDDTRQARTTVVFRSPASGYVIDKPVLQGMHVAPGQTLYKIADLSRVWIEADVYEQEMPYVRVGRAAVVTLDAYPGERFNGRAVYVYPFVEERTRTVKVRFDFPNPAGRLRPGMFANVEMQATAGTGLSIPADAVIESGRQQLVFVAQGDGYFEPREIQVGRRLGDRVEVLQNLKEGEQVAASATFFIDSESQLRGAIQGYEPAPAPASGTTAAPRHTVTFRSEPDPLRAGDNTLEVTLRDANGRAISDGEVSVTFFMAAMPSMNMPAMRSQATLGPVGNGLYRGTGQVLSRGRWEVTVIATRAGQRLATSEFSITTQ